MRQLYLFSLALVLFGVADSAVDARSRRAATPISVDLATAVQGTYYGDIVSDSRGSSQSGVTISVDDVAPNTVRVTCDNERLPEFTVRLTRAMQTIQQASGENVFLIDQSKRPWSLDVTVDEASWSGTKR